MTSAGTHSCKTTTNDHIRSLPPLVARVEPKMVTTSSDQDDQQEGSKPPPTSQGVTESTNVPKMYVQAYQSLFELGTPCTSMQKQPCSASNFQRHPHLMPALSISGRKMD